jgi:hypothetical protein
MFKCGLYPALFPNKEEQKEMRHVFEFELILTKPIIIILLQEMQKSATLQRPWELNRLFLP